MPPRRSLSLLAILVVGIAASTLSGATRIHSHARWPTSEAFFHVDGWTAGPNQVGLLEGGEPSGVLLQRSYVDTVRGARAELAMWSIPQPQAKQLFRKGPDRDFLGDGYVTQPAPAGLVPPIPGGGALVASRGSGAWLLVYAFGERRGALGAGPLAWALAELDAVLDTPNDYFLVRVAVPYDSDAPPPSDVAMSLASPLFARVGDWYAASP